MEREATHVEAAQQRRGELEARIKTLSEQMSFLPPDPVKTITTSDSLLGALLGVPSPPPKSVSYGPRTTLAQEIADLWSQLSNLDAQLKQARVLRRRLREAQAGESERQKRIEERDRQHASLAETSLGRAADLFDRQEFAIQPRDYRRGNAIENYVRKHFLAVIIEGFGRRCAVCTSAQDLTLDHYGLTKNEGGNFILIGGDGSWFRANVVVLCRSCNAAKAQIPHGHFFTSSQREVIRVAHDRILRDVVADRAFGALARKWHRALG